METVMIPPILRFLSTGLIATFLMVSSAQAIVIRHDRDDARYQELGAGFPAVARIIPDGTGVLVTPEFVLTAAHVARVVAGQSPRVEIQGREFAVERIFIHPEWNSGPHDIALFRLHKPVKGVTPARLYRDADETGQTITFVGYGDHGTGLTGPKTMDGIKRGATNVIDEADDDWLFFSFDKPSDGTDLEGVSGPGDSGGPALLTRDGKVYTVGVSVFADGDGGPGLYGIREGYTRVSTHLDWIESILSGKNPDQGSQPGKRSQAKKRPGGQAVSMTFGGQASLPETPRGKQVGAYVAAYNTGRDQDMLDYQGDHFDDSLLEEKSAQDRIAFYRRLYDELFGVLKLKQVVADDQESMRVLFETDKGGLAEFQFELEAAQPHRIKGIRVAKVSLDGHLEGQHSP
jgi:hypothetical protein